MYSITPSGLAGITQINPRLAEAINKAASPVGGIDPELLAAIGDKMSLNRINTALAPIAHLFTKGELHNGHA